MQQTILNWSFRRFIATALVILAGFTTPAFAQSAYNAPTQLGPQTAGNQTYSTSRAPERSAYAPPPADYGDQYAQPQSEDNTYSPEEIFGVGHSFFGRVSTGLARVVEYAFSTSGRPNGYILGEEAGGAFVAGLRYGEGTLHTKDAGAHKVFWQGPSLGYDFGAEGSKTMVLVYNLRSLDDLYGRFAGVDGSAYFIGGVGLTYQKRDHITLAPIRSGVGLRLGANVGYLKYTRRPTWNPF